MPSNSEGPANTIGAMAGRVGFRKKFIEAKT
jgi:hypothetical protein